MSTWTLRVIRKPYYFTIDPYYGNLLYKGSNLSYHNKETILFTIDHYYGALLYKGLNLSYHNTETILFTIDPYYGNLN